MNDTKWSQQVLFIDMYLFVSKDYNKKVRGYEFEKEEKWREERKGEWYKYNTHI